MAVWPEADTVCPQAWIFMAPVDRQVVPEYDTLVTVEVTLPQVTDKIKQLKYTSKDAYFKDILLVIR